MYGETVTPSSGSRNVIPFAGADNIRRLFAPALTACRVALSNRRMADTRTARSFVGLAAGEAVARLIAFAATLLVARRLGPAMYGIIGVTSGIMLYLTQVADGGVELSGVPAVARQRTGLTELVSATLTGRVLVAVALSVIVVAIGVTAAPQPDGAILAVYASGLVFVGAGVRWVFVGLQRSTWVAAARVLGELTTLGVVIVALDDVGDVAFVPFASVLGAAVAALIMFAGLAQLGVRPIVSTNWSLSRDLFARGPHLVGFTLLGLVLFNADLIYLRVVSGEKAAGLYAAAYTFIAFAANLSVAWAHSVMPAIARPGQDPGWRASVYARAQALAFAAAIPVSAGGVVVASHLIDLVFGDEYLPAVSALVWLLPAIPLAAVREVVYAALIAAPGGERQLVRVNALSAVFNLVILIPVVPRFGATGAAAVTVLTEALRLTVAVRASRRAGYPTPAVGRFRRPLAAALLMMAVLFAAGDRHLVVQVVAGMLLYSTGLFVTGVVRLGPAMKLRLEV